MRAQAGCLLGDVDRETELHGLAAVLGFVSTTGIAGSHAGRRVRLIRRAGFGWTSGDNLHSIAVVTADGRRACERAIARTRICSGRSARRRRQLRCLPHGLRVPRCTRLARVLGRRHRVAGARRTPRRRSICFVMVTAARHPLELDLRRSACGSRLPLPSDSEATIHGQPHRRAVRLPPPGPPDVAEPGVAPIKRHGAPVGDIVRAAGGTSRSRTSIYATQPKSADATHWKSESTRLPRYEPDLLEMFDRALGAHRVRPLPLDPS